MKVLKGNLQIRSLFNFAEVPAAKRNILSLSIISCFSIFQHYLTRIPHSILWRVQKEWNKIFFFFSSCVGTRITWGLSVPQGLTITLCRRWGRFGAYHIPATLQAARRNKAGGRTAPGCCSAPVPWSAVLSADLWDLNNHVLEPKPSYFGAWICSFNSLEPPFVSLHGSKQGRKSGELL